MKKITITILSLLIIVSCMSKKKTAASANPVPGEAQLAAIRTKNPNATADLLNRGYAIYTGPCTRCHGAKDIVSRSEEEWPRIIDRMVPRAKLSAEEKEAVYSYVMSVKLSQK
jgi:cytochrome c553